MAALAAGAGEQMLCDALQFAIDRKQFGHAVAEFQLV
ncbi:MULTISPECIES: hypothetical protein [unclassified Bradyrhizobium]